MGAAPRQSRSAPSCKARKVKVLLFQKPDTTSRPPLSLCLAVYAYGTYAVILSPVNSTLRETNSRGRFDNAVSLTLSIARGSATESLPSHSIDKSRKLSQSPWFQLAGLPAAAGDNDHECGASPSGKNICQSGFRPAGRQQAV